jgi:hypothetical protein
VIDYSLSVNSDVLSPNKFGGFERFVRGRNYLVNNSGVFGMVETDDTLANTLLQAPQIQWYGEVSATEAWYMHSDQLGSEDEPGHLTRIGTGKEPINEATHRMADEPEWTNNDARGTEKCMEIADDSRGRPGLRDRVAATWAHVVIKRGYGSRPIVGANASEGRHAGKDHRPRRT